MMTTLNQNISWLFFNCRSQQLFLKKKGKVIVKATGLICVLVLLPFILKAQKKEYTIIVPTEQISIETSKPPGNPNSEKAFRLVQEIIHYANLHSSIACMEKLNPLLEDTLKKEMKKIKEETAYLLAINYDACKFLKLYPDKGQKDLWDNYTTLYHITLYPDITLHPDFPSIPIIKKDDNSSSKSPLLATYQNEKGQWIAWGPYIQTDGYATENQAIGSLFYADTDLSFLCQRGKYRIYKLNIKVEHNATDIRYALKLLGITDIPDK